MNAIYRILLRPWVSFRSVGETLEIRLTARGLAFYRRHEDEIDAAIRRRLAPPRPPTPIHDQLTEDDFAVLAMEREEDET